MPRVSINKKKYKVCDLSAWIAGKMYAQGIRQAEMGELIGVSQSSFSHRLEKGLFDYEDLLAIFKRLNATDEEILKFMKL